jgi:hypothetical protein
VARATGANTAKDQPESEHRLATTAAVADEEAFYSNIAGFVTVRYPVPNTPNSPVNCRPGQLEVKTFDQNVNLTNQIAFTVNVP